MYQPEYPCSEEELMHRIEASASHVMMNYDEQSLYRLMLSVIDLTTLEGTDTPYRIESICNQALAFADRNRNIAPPAAVCVYVPFVAQAKKLLQDSPIKVATVVCAFPSGQAPVELKLAEVKYAIEAGADEIDMVISRGKFLSGSLQEVFDEIAAVREICANVTLKVILETGELGSASNIYRASLLSMKAGADFIKSSTGKITESATPRSVMIMADAIKHWEERTQKMVGLKPAGGLSDIRSALFFMQIIDEILGNKWLNNRFLRLGTSRFANILAQKIN
ncbi:MAG: deoxyribose-phosphate aldolase [Bacteroidales bacterium]|jgi:deoxyribose-phosphate aldolase|nr:deoxyribose-phosphate aldolase [Bacteroidales bacterium]